METISPRIERQATPKVVQDISNRYRNLITPNSKMQKQTNKFGHDQLKRDEDPTAIWPAVIDGVANEYVQYHTVDTNAFLSSKLTGKVLDVASGGINELEGIVPEEQIVYSDREQFYQKRFVQADATRLPFGEKVFDGAYSSSAIGNHIGDAKKAIGELLRVVKPGGTLVLSPLNDEYMNLILEALQANEINIEQQCELLLDETFVQHTSLPSIDQPFRFNIPSIYISVQLESENSL